MKFTTIASVLALTFSSLSLSAAEYENDTINVMVKKYNQDKYEKLTINKSELESLKADSDYQAVEVDHWVGNKPSERKSQNFMSTLGFAQSQSTTNFDDPDYFFQYYFKTQEESQGAASIAEAISKSEQNEKLRIAVIDGGFEDVDDFTWSYGYNFFDEWGEVRGPEFRDITDEQKECSAGHGLSVGSIIGAIANNGVGMAGIVDAEMIALRSLSCGIGPLSDTADAILHAAGDTVDDIPAIEPVDIINISIAGNVGGCPSYLQDAIDYANDKGIMIFVAAGNKNESTDGYAPASCEGVFVTGASTQNGFKAEFSNHGPKVNAMMAGVDIIGYASNGETGWWEGTSQASPLMAGIAALGKQHNPQLTREEIFGFLEMAASPLRDDVENAEQDCGEDKCGTGLVNASVFMDYVTASSDGGLYSLTHALAENTTCDQELFLSQMGNASRLCSMYELDVKGLNEGDSYKVVQTEINQAFDENSVVLTEATAQKVLLDSLDLNTYKYGVRICTTDACETESVVTINTENASSPAICD